ncbi:GNAT family N-acetyltransferase [soil metagenome]
MIIRPAAAADIEPILGIFNAAIRTSTAIWRDAEVDYADRERWLDDHRRTGDTVLVAEVDGVVAGYASFSQWRGLVGFRFSVENSIYIAEGFQGQGIGRALMTELIGRARAAGKHLMIADITGGNTASIRLHESLGFEPAGVIREVGTKFGEWLDLVILQLRL